MTTFKAPDFSELDPGELRVRKGAARVVVTADKGSGDILPRFVYELADVPVPDNANDELQRNPTNAEHQFYWPLD